MDEHSIERPRKKGQWIAVAVILVLVSMAVVFWPRSPLAGANVHDFGEVSFEQGPHYVYHTFELTNTSDETVEVSRYTSTCGCTQPRLPDRVVAPGDVLQVPVSLRLSRSGLKEGKVTLFLKGKGSFDLTVRGRGKPVQTFRATPSRVRLRSPSGRSELNLVVESHTHPTEAQVTGPPEVQVRVEPWKQLDAGDADEGKVPGWSAKVFLEAAQQWPPPGSEVVFTLSDGRQTRVVINTPHVDTAPDSGEIPPEKPLIFQ